MGKSQSLFNENEEEANASTTSDEGTTANADVTNAPADETTAESAPVPEAPKAPVETKEQAKARIKAEKEAQKAIEDEAKAELEAEEEAERAEAEAKAEAAEAANPSKPVNPKAQADKLAYYKKCIETGEKPEKDMIANDNDMRDYLMSFPQEMVMVPLYPGEKPGTTETVIVNGVRLNILKGSMVKIPKPFAEQIFNHYSIGQLEGQLGADSRIDGNKNKEAALNR